MTSSDAGLVLLVIAAVFVAAFVILLTLSFIADAIWFWFERRRENEEVDDFALQDGRSYRHLLSKRLHNPPEYQKGHDHDR